MLLRAALVEPSGAADTPAAAGAFVALPAGAAEGAASAAAVAAAGRPSVVQGTAVEGHFVCSGLGYWA
jgi:hypothetical protein